MFEGCFFFIGRVDPAWKKSKWRIPCCCNRISDLNWLIGFFNTISFQTETLSILHTLQLKIAPENGWLEDDPFLLGRYHFQGIMLNFGSAEFSSRYSKAMKLGKKRIIVGLPSRVVGVSLRSLPRSL